MKITVLENNSNSKIVAIPIKIVAYINTDGKSMDFDNNLIRHDYDEIIVQKVNSENRGWDCLLICKKHNSYISIYTAFFNDGFFEK